MEYHFCVRQNVNLLLVAKRMIWQAEGKKITIHDNNVGLFKQEGEIIKEILFKRYKRNVTMLKNTD